MKFGSLNKKTCIFQMVVSDLAYDYPIASNNHHKSRHDFTSVSMAKNVSDNRRSVQTLVRAGVFINGI